VGFTGRSQCAAGINQGQDMTDNTPPEALRLAEEISNLVCSSEAAAKTIAAAADELCRLHVENASLRAQQPASPPTEQQATKETSGGFHVWRDIATAPKDGSRFVATGHNYGLYSEVRHTCVAQWFRGCWMEASDWNEASELKYLTHWMPLPSPPDDVAAPAEQQAAPKAAPGESDYSKKWDAELGRTAMRFVDRAGDVHPGIDDAETICAEFYKAMSEVIERMPHVQRMTPRKAAPGEPVFSVHKAHLKHGVGPWCREALLYSPDNEGDYPENRVMLYTTPQPAPAPLSESEYKRGYRDGYERRDAEVRGALV
jgi:hypothetical protein